ncbi:UDP-2,3-diacylglucosamine diphosphatase [Mangrovimicrobium sediminis]|uniref:UDP-2,3-diacylglucosamine diphosphatase n=1 Tax=Mangrovimicrobium sediminis TaxID=2562682 RepID=A0A4Z0M902_9GAMM|nr:UDP-2,3-diacylglucosamine diphosphatase [Haliea sp. SAOS-164]TGD75775.1 UDP-2,3-diacylglucosamine diphosphatase [Haliea sp. SAOS-164]
MNAQRPDGHIDCETLWISDVHLGNVHSKAEHLLQLLKRVHCKKLYLVGDIVDVWAMHRRVYWPEAHNAVLRELLKKSRAGVEVIYVPGNHDQNFREFCGSEFGNVSLRERAVHTTADGRRFLVIHGDELDFAVRYSRINRWIGDIAYDMVMMLNRMLNHLRALSGRPYWSLAGWLKSHVAQAEQAINAYQQAAVKLAADTGYDGIICGHLHHPVVKQYDQVLYCNDGDWVENCTALVEDARGQLHLIKAVSLDARVSELILAAA